MDENEFNRLLKRIRDSKPCFDRLYKYYFPKIVFYITDNFGDENMAQDVAQDFFEGLFTNDNLPNFVKYPTWWIMRSCDNIAKNMIGSHRSERRRATLASEKRAFDTQRLLDPGLADLRGLLAALDETTARIVVMHVCEGYGFKELSGLLNLGYDAVRQRFSRGLKRMREVSEERDRDPFE